jgi:molybdenum cofactor cytidylyltransferase
MGRDMALLPWPPPLPGSAGGIDTFLSTAIRSLLGLCDFVIVVAGSNASRLAPLVYVHNASLVQNPAPERGQFSSLQVGLQEVLNHGRDAAIITLVDRPPARAATLTTLHQAFLAAPSDIWATVPEYKGKHGHPFIAGRELMHAFLKASPTANAREIEHQHESHIQYFPIDDPYITLNIDTPAAYSALLAAPAMP